MRKGVVNRWAEGAIEAYRQFLRPYVGSCCRFEPSCSAYALECFREHRWDRALKWTVKRLLKCHPWHEGGDDPVPPVQAEHSVHG